MPGLPNTRSVLLVAVMFCSSAACSSEGDEKPSSKPPKAPTSNGAQTAKAKTAPTKNAKSAPASNSCNAMDGMPSDGEVTAIEHLAGKDNLSLHVVDGKVALRRGALMTGSNLRVVLRGSYAQAEAKGRKICVGLSRLTFYLPRFKPELNKSIPYKFSGDVHSFAQRRASAIYVDVNQDKAVVGMGKPTIEYMGAEGSFKFTKLNEGTGKRRNQTIEFSIVFQKVTDNKLDPSVKTKLTGSFNLETMGPM